MVSLFYSNYLLVDNSVNQHCRCITKFELRCTFIMSGFLKQFFDSNTGNSVFIKIYNFFNKKLETRVTENIKVVSGYIM